MGILGLIFKIHPGFVVIHSHSDKKRLIFLLETGRIWMVNEC